MVVSNPDPEPQAAEQLEEKKQDEAEADTSKSGGTSADQAETGPAVVDAENFVITEVVPDNTTEVAIQDVVETVIDEPSTSESSGSQVVLNSNTAAVIQTIIEALTAAAAEATSEEAEAQKEGAAAADDSATAGTDGDGSGPSTSSSSAAKSKGKALLDDPTSTADAAAALQALASQASGMSAPDAIAHLQQMLQVPSHVVSSLVNEVASEVIGMAHAVQNATQAVESMMDDNSADPQSSEPVEIKKTKGGMLKIHKCPECHKGFSLRSTLTKHLERHTTETKCPQCDKVFFSKVKLATHIRTHHTPTEKVRDVLCSECGKGFYNHAKLRVHMRSHTGERPYPCTFCEKRFICTSHRKRHERLHTGEHPFVCETCGKGFGSPSNLKDHTYTHTKENPYPCSICGKGFTQWGAMMRHIAAIHEKRKDVKCPHCNKCFSRKDYLKLHIQRCHWNKCPNCKNTFETMEVFNRHKEECTGPPPGMSGGRGTPRTPVKRKAVSSPQKAATSPRKSQRLSGSPHTSPQIKVMLTPARKKARKSPAVPPISRRKRTTSAHIDQIMSIYDQFDDDPLVDPDYEDEVEEDGEEMVEEEEEEGEMEEIVEEEGVGVDQEEILVQEGVLQDVVKVMETQQQGGGVEGDAGEGAAEQQEGEVEQ